MKEIVAFNNFIFDYNTGELINVANKQEKKIIRLQPQSAKLLQTLIKNYPELLSKDEIRSLLWPNVEVDFDNSLHYCIRQIRVALQDDVSSPKYVETIPRRGYRWLVEIEQPKKKRKTTKYWIVGIVLLIFSSIGFNYYLSMNNHEREVATIQKESKIRLVIMPLQPTDSLNLFYGNMIAYDLLSLFRNMDELEVIGPTTTQNINQETLYDFIEESDADFIINGKFSQNGQDSRLLVEIIRASDMAHVWVVAFKTDSSFDHITSEIYNGFSNQMININRQVNNINLSPLKRAFILNVIQPYSIE